MNSEPLISVIIPVYNGEKFLAGCLDALAATSYRQYELIVVDDCSTDRSAEISREKGASPGPEELAIWALRKPGAKCCFLLMPM